MLNKFRELMKNELESLPQQARCLKKVQFDMRSQSSSTGSQQSMTDSKLGELLQSSSLQNKDLLNLIKDNYSYFKHFFQLCICTTCECGLCRCSYMKKDNKGIKFRGALITLYNESFQNSSKLPQTAINRNQFQHTWREAQHNKEFNCSDKVVVYFEITANPAAAVFQQDPVKPKTRQYKVPLFYTESSSNFLNKQGISDSLTVRMQSQSGLEHSQSSRQLPEQG